MMKIEHLHLSHFPLLPSAPCCSLLDRGNFIDFRHIPLFADRAKRATEVSKPIRRLVFAVGG